MEPAPVAHEEVYLSGTPGRNHMWAGSGTFSSESLEPISQTPQQDDEASLFHKAEVDLCALS